MITTTCPHCRRPLQIPSQFAGQPGHCNHCHAALTVPGRAAVPCGRLRSPSITSITSIPSIPPPQSQSQIEAFDPPDLNTLDVDLTRKSRPLLQPDTQTTAARLSVDSNPTTLLLGILGSVIMAGGVFCPIIAAPFYHVSFFSMAMFSHHDGLPVLIFAAIAFVLTLARLTRWTYIPALASIAFYIITIIIIEHNLDNLDLAAAALISYDWGCAILAAGSLTILASSALTR